MDKSQTISYSLFDQTIYTGRYEAYENSLARYWYQSIQAFDQQDIALLGFACDQGVNRNQGRVGAKNAPALLKATLGKLPVSAELQEKYRENLMQCVGDAGTIHCRDDNLITSDILEQAQQYYANILEDLIQKEKMVIGIGGGHEIAWGSFLGLSSGLARKYPHAKIGIINFDAHLDLRQDQYASSGTPFKQIADDRQAKGQDFYYCCVGVSQFSNTAALFERAKLMNVKMISDDDCYRLAWEEIEAQLLSFIEPLDYLYLTIDLDCLQASVMPAVSAVAAKGLSLDFVERCIVSILRTRKVRMIDVAEFNPLYDIDGRGAKVAARLLALTIEQYLLNRE